MKTLAAVLLMTIVPAAAAAQIQKCLDSSGKVVGYGAECPPGTRAEQTAIKSAPAAAPAPKPLAEREAEFRKRQMEQQEAAAKAEKSSADAAQRKRACEDSQAYLKTLQNRERIRKTDPKTGERTYLSEADYPREIARAQKSVADYCK